MSKWIWRLFYLFVVVFLVHSIALAFGIDLSKNSSFYLVVFILPVSLFILHIIYSLGIWRSILFISLASGIGWTMETIGLRDGVVFGGRYVYTGHGMAIGTVPLVVCLYWSVFIYTGYSLVNSFLYWLHRKRPTVSKNMIFRVIPLVLLDATFVTIIDLFMDPIQVRDGGWRWLDGGAYFDIPIGNFIGWFITAALVLGIYRVIEYYLPIKVEKKDSSIVVLPTILYGMLAISFSISATQFGLYTLVAIGASLMFPIVITNLYLYARFIKQEHHSQTNK